MRYSLLKLIAVFLLICGYAQTVAAQDSQGSKVRGHIYGENNERLVGPMVILKEDPLHMNSNSFASAVVKDGFFEIDSRNDSVLLNVFFIGYKPVEMKVPRDCEVNIHMELDPALDPNVIIGDPPAIPRRLRTGYIFDDKGKSIFGAHILVQEEDINIDIETSSNKDGYFEIRSGDFGELTINVDGHKPIEFDLKTLKEEGGEELMLVKHDGLFIIIDFNW